MLRAMLCVAALLLAAACTQQRPAPRVTLQCLDPSQLEAQRDIPAGPVNRGDVAFRPEEHVGGHGQVAAFSIDVHEVTNQQYAAFVAATRYITVAERNGADGQRLGAAVFDPERHDWRIDHTADWRHPSGTNSNITGHDSFPVVQIAYEDAQAYAQWRGRRLPTENEWERAARGDAPPPSDIRAEAYANNVPTANTWQGVFPVVDRGDDGFLNTAPVGCYHANTQGLYDTIGNVWEWTSDWFAVDRAPIDEAYAREHDPQHLAQHVIKGGSYLCSLDFCSRFRSGSRQPADPGQGMSHLGFRTVGPPSRSADASQLSHQM